MHDAGAKGCLAKSSTAAVALLQMDSLVPDDHVALLFPRYRHSILLVVDVLGEFLQKSIGFLFRQIVQVMNVGGDIQILRQSALTDTEMDSPFVLTTRASERADACSLATW